MRISRGLRRFGLYFVMPTSLALVLLGIAFVVVSINLPDDFDKTVTVGEALEFDKTVPLPQDKLSSYSGEQIFESAYQAYVCSFLMTLADQIDKGQFLRFYSVTLMEEELVRDLGGNWNDINFPGALDATNLSNKFVEKHNVSKADAATRILNEDSQCITLNKFTEFALKARK
jgi:hypothetical protein